MNKFNRMNEFFDGSFGDEPDLFGEQDFEPYVFSVAFPEAPDRINQRVKIVKGRLVVSMEFVFDDVELLEDFDED